MKIYTRTGDRGRTGVPGKGRVPKSHPRLEAVGDVDELNSAVGAAMSLLPRERAFDGLRESLRRIQSELLWAGSLVAFAPKKPPNPHARPLDAARLEREIDALWGRTPPLNHFVLPGGSPPAAFLHLARCVCRRAERSVVALGRQAPEEAVVYLNRLSDYLFAAARRVNAALKTPERAWMDP